MAARPNLIRRFALLAVVAMTVTACLGNDFEDSLEGSWQLVSGEVAGTPIPIVKTHPITLTIAEDAVGGTASCNGYGAEIDRPFRVTGISSTEMACSPPETMVAEGLYLQGLGEVDNIGLGSPNLTLTGPTVTLEFEPLAPVPTADLLGTVWVLDGLVQGDAVSSVSGERATLELFTDGSFIGSTGCRDLSGSYVVTGPEVQFTNFGANGDCTAQLATQDSRVISALEGGFRVEIVGNQMTTWVAGDEGLIYRADP